ncbi:MAG: ABC transporter ATP-binding protein [Hyphomicrobiaceae bacterium]
MRLETQAIDVRLGTRDVLAGVTAHCEAGELVGVIGPNGAGKSTLLKAMAGLIAPVAGRVLLDGEDIRTLSRGDLAHRLAYLPQSRTVHWPVTVETLVGLGRLPYAAFAVEPSAGDREAITRAMQTAEVTHLATRLASELSGGELARVLMARALAQEPKILIADEPSAGLDPAHQLSLFRHMRGLADSGLGVIVALHDLSAAARYCHRLVLMQAGGVLADGSPREVLTPERLSQAFDVTAVVTEIDGVPVVVAH